MRLRILAALLLSVAPTPVVAQSVLSAREAAAALAKVSQFKPKDAFEPVPDRSAFAGQRFRIAWPISNGAVAAPDGAVSRTGFWTYDPESGALRLVADPDVVLASDRGANLPPGNEAYKFDGTGQKPGVPFAAQNGYGAQVMVTPTQATEFSIAQIYDSYDPSRSLAHRHEKTLTLPPDQARDLVGHLVLVAEGTVQPYDGKHTIFCGDWQIPPKIDALYAMTFRQCALTGIIERPSFQSTDTGQVVAEWRDGSQG